MSYVGYHQRFLDINKFIEWVDGEAIVFAPPTTRHQERLTFLVSWLSHFVSIYRMGEVIISPYEMKLAPMGNARLPDILYVASENSGRIDEYRLNGPADLVVEIVDTGTVGRDRGDKFYDYQANGVREYWIVDPRPGVARADFWVLGKDGRYRPIPINEDGTYDSTILPNFKLNVNSLFEAELPGSLQALVEMIGIEALKKSPRL